MYPSVTVMVPTLNEEKHIGACIASLADQSYPGDISLLVIDGGSEDATVEICKALGVDVIENRYRVQSYGLNLGAQYSTSEVLVRADAHSEYAPDYVQMCVATLARTDAQAVGGPMRPVGVTSTEKAIAAAMMSPIAIGPGRFHSEIAEGPVDTVYLGAFRRLHFIERGGYRHLPSHVAEDADMFYRWRQANDIVFLNPAIRSWYRPRESVGALLRQFIRYGAGKADMWFVNGSLPSLRPLAPLSLVVAIGLTSWLALIGVRWPLFVVLGAWLSAVGLAWASSKKPSPIVPLAVAVMHLGYGWGILWGCTRHAAARVFGRPLHVDGPDTLDVGRDSPE